MQRVGFVPDNDIIRQSAHKKYIRVIPYWVTGGSEWDIHGPHRHYSDHLVGAERLRIDDWDYTLMGIPCLTRFHSRPSGKRVVIGRGKNTQGLEADRKVWYSDSSR